MPQIIDVFEENDIAEVGDVHTLGAVYWSFPADNRQGFETDISAAVASSYTVESQREQVAKFAAWSGFEVINEVALQFDLSLGLDDQQRGRLSGKAYREMARLGEPDTTGKGRATDERRRQNILWSAFHGRANS